MILPILARTFLTFTVLLLLTRITGKKQLSQSTFFDFVSAIAIGDLAAEHLGNPEDPLLPWVLATGLWFALIIALDVLVMRSRTMGKLVEGEPTILIENGQLLERNLRRNYLRVDDLMARLRSHGYFNPREVEYAVFETDGSISVLPRSQSRPVQPKDLGIATPYEGMTRELIVDRQVVRANLHSMNLSLEWLTGELIKQGYAGPEEIFYAALDTQGRLYVNGYNDRLADTHVRVSDQGPH
ncbi:MAG: DUF421 domain-containing protein [Bacillota bacterium]